MERMRQLLALALLAYATCLLGVAVAEDLPSSPPLAALMKELWPTSGPHAAWTKVCVNGPTGSDCYIVRDASRDPALGALSIHRFEGRYLAVVRVPDNSLVPFGVSWRVDEGKMLRIPFRTCFSGFCFADLESDAQGLNSLKSGSTLKIGFNDRQNVEQVFEIDLRGFTKALNDL